MNKKLQDNLEKEIDKLKNSLANFDTMSVLGLIANDLRINFNIKPDFSKINLASPHKELLYVAGLLLCTEQKKKKIFSKNNYNKVKKDVSKITSMYSLLFFPTKEEMEKGLSDEWNKARDVSMPVFLNYFNTTPLYYKEQVIERIQDWFLPLNGEFRKHHSFNISILIDFYEFIAKYIQDYFENLSILNEKASEEKNNFLNSKELQEAKNLEEERELAQKHPVKGAFEKYFQQIRLVHHISISELQTKFGKDVVNEIINIFSITRAQCDFRYYTEQNPVEKSPLWKLSDEYLFCPFLEQLLNSIYQYLYDFFEKSSIQQNFYNNRDKHAENKTKAIFENFLGNEATFYNAVYETDKAQNEHDLLITVNDALFIVEVKASKQKEPFRDPDKAFIRIKRNFKSDRGIQKAFDQAYHLKKLLASKEKTPLFDSTGNNIITFNKFSPENVYIICVTVEQLGMIASNLSFLLDKPKDEPYPLAVNLYDLENLLEGFLYKKKTTLDFIQYLNERQKYHVQLFASDELEIAGSYLVYGSLSKSIKSDKMELVFTPDMSDIFDKIYFEKQGISYDSEYDKEPVVVNFNEQLQHILRNETVQNNSKPNKKKKLKKNKKRKR